MSQDAPYATLSPDTVLAAVDAMGTWSDGRLLALNSYENRVFQVGLEDGGFVVAKFYRPGRWTDAQIEEEHALAAELAAAELPMVAPVVHEGRTLQKHAGFRYAVYPRRGGRAPSLESREQLEWLGRLIARMHLVGARQPFQHRPALDQDAMVHGPARAVLASALLPAHVSAAYREAVQRVAQGIDTLGDALGPLRTIRLHGDCHPGNVLWTDAGPHFVDLDDARQGPAVQDLWMLAADDAGFDALVEGYEQFRPLDPAERAFVPALRAMRQVHHAGWIASRWHDPAFPAAFPFAAEARWWEQHVADLHDAADAL